MPSGMSGKITGSCSVFSLKKEFGYPRKFSESPFQEKISTTDFKLDNLVKRVVFCYPSDVAAEFTLNSRGIQFQI